METDFRALLAADATVAGLVGSRVYPTVRPQGAALPCITFQPISMSADYTLSDATGFEVARVQVDIYGATATSAYAARDAVQAAISGHQGTQGDTDFRGIFIDGLRAMHETDGAGGSVHRVSIDFEIHHRRA